MATITPFADAVTLTPVRVKKIRPSLSPVKSPKEPKAKIRALSEVLGGRPVISPQAEFDNSTAALNFKEFSFWNSDGRLATTSLSKEHRQALLSYLGEHYGVIAMIVSLPFLVLECEPDLPPEDQRPFSVAGAISVWVKPDYFNVYTVLVGEKGRGPRITVSEDLAKDLKQMKSPKQETLLALAQIYFQDAIAISYIWDSVVVELPLMDVDLFITHLEALPEAFSNANSNLAFHNGNLPYTEQKRAVKPNATYNKGPEAIVDDTDYVKEQSCFYPGSMIHAVGEAGENIGSVTAGIMVEKGLMRRLTVSYHCWESIIESKPEAFGSLDTEFCKVLQGEPGTKVGFVHERIESTDIALAKLLPSIEFRNEFMEMQARASRLLPSGEISLGDEFLVDSFVTGKQRLRCVGMRYLFVRKANSRSHPRLVGPDDLLPRDESLYVELAQGIYASNEEKIPGQPKIREGICGAVLLRCFLRSSPERTANSVLHDGEVAGIMHFADLQSKNNPGSLLCYADSFDALAEAGWTVVQMAEKRSEPGNGGDEL
jgi:hypothetical protein